MKSKKFRVDVYDWDVRFIEITSRKDTHKVITILKEFGTQKHILKEIEKHIKSGSTNGGYHSYNTKYNKSIITVYPFSSKENRRNVIAHEKRHLEDVILRHFSVYNDEAAAFLAGYLAKKLF